MKGEGGDMEPRASQGGAAPSAGRLEFQTTNLWAGAFVLGSRDR